MKQILPKFRNSDFTFVNNNDLISDITDGEFYKDFSEKESVCKTENYVSFSFSFNCDGIAVCDKSKLSILSINELPIQDRFVFDNIIIVGNLTLILIFNYL